MKRSNPCLRGVEARVVLEISLLRVCLLSRCQLFRCVLEGEFPFPGTPDDLHDLRDVNRSESLMEDCCLFSIVHLDCLATVFSFQKQESDYCGGYQTPLVSAHPRSHSSLIMPRSPALFRRGSLYLSRRNSSGLSFRKNRKSLYASIQSRDDEEKGTFLALRSTS